MLSDSRKKYCSQYHNRFLSCMVVLICILLQPEHELLWAQENASQNLVQVTSHPAEDLAPSLSRDGKWLVFASKRTGNYDIWLKNMVSGRLRRLTKHRADQFHPVWDPKQQYIVYVSQQSDAHGDLYRLNLRNVDGDLIPKGEPERLTFYMGFDGYPSMSKNDQNIAWVSDRTGRSEIWLMTKRRKNVRQLTHGGATHPAWSPVQDYLAFTSFRDDACNGDIWLINLYASSEWIKRETPIDSLERAMWPITKGPAVDGFPTWSDDANTLLFSRHDYDTNGDGTLSPADNSVLWSVDVRHLPSDSQHISNPSFEMFRASFDQRIATSARPVTPLYYDARQPSWYIDNKTFFITTIKGKPDVWSFVSPEFFVLPDDFALDYINTNFPLPRQLKSTQLDMLSQFRDELTADEEKMLWDRWAALHQIIDGDSIDSNQQAQALYEAGMCLTLLSYGAQARTYFEYVLHAFPLAKEHCSWSDLVLQTLKSLPKKAAHAQVVDALINTVEPQQLKYADEPTFQAQTTILLGRLWTQKGDIDQANFCYQKVEEYYSQFPALIAQSLFLRGLLYEPVDERTAFQYYIDVMQKYPHEAEWPERARNRLLELSIKNAKTDAERVEFYRQFHNRLREYNAASAEPLFRAAEQLKKMDRVEEAFAQYDSIIVQYADQPEQVFAARLNKAELLVHTGEFVEASSAFQQLADDYKKSAPQLEQQATDRLVDVLLSSAADLKRSKNWTISRMRYEQVLDIAPFNIKAHQGYIETLFQLGLAEQAVEEYELLKKKNRDNKVVLYALGLAYSYRGTPQRNNVFMPGDVIPDDLKKSNSFLRRAMSRDYNLIEAYLALSYNYEMLENNLHWEKNKPRNFWHKAGGAITGPFVWAYRTVTFYNETKAPRYYENSIQVLTSALSLNDESKRPDLEAHIALNMANNYYNVGEFGFAKAYEFYHLRMQYDSTFTDPYQEALIMERMGHCAMVVVDADLGPDYLLRAIELYDDRNDRDRVLVNTKRLALLYEFAEDSRNALVYYQQAAEIERRRRLYDGLLRSYRSLAYHNYLLNQPDEAVFYANKGFALLDDGLVERSEGKPLFPQIGIIGIDIPVPYDLRRVGAKSVLQLTTDEEEAILYSILASTLQDAGQYQKAISFYEKKLDIYQQRFDYEAQAIFKNNIAYLYFLQGDYDRAWLEMTHSYWFARRKTKRIGVQVLNIINAGHVFLTMANEPDESKRINIAGRHIWIIDKLNEMLRKTNENAGLYAQSRMHLHILLADVYMVDIYSDPDGDLRTNISASYRMMQNVSKADTYLLKALAIARDKGYVDDECAIHLKRGRALQSLGLLNDAVDELSTCLNLAIQYQNSDALWRVNTALGQILKEIKTNDPEHYNFEHEPLYYFQQAVKISERYNKVIPGFTAAHRRELVQEPYREIIQLYVEHGSTDKALALAEHMRERHVFDTWHAEHIDLGGRRQELFVTLDSLRREIDGLEFTLQKISDANLSQRLRYAQTEYDNVILDMRREAPELEQFIQISPVDINELRTFLPDSLVLLYHIAAEDHSLFWSISQDTVTVESISMNKNAALHQLNSQTMPKEMQNLLAKQNASSQIIFIPDYDFLVYPWSLLSKTVEHSSQIISVSSSLTSFAHALKNSHSRGQTIYIAGAENIRLPENYTVRAPVPQQSDNPFEAQLPLLAEVDVIHINAWVNWNWMAPTSSSMHVEAAQSQPMTLSTKDFYTFNTDASHLSLNILNSTPPDPDAFIAWERAAVFSGVSSLIFSSNSALDSTGTFYSQFYNNMVSSASDQAFQNSIITLDFSNDAQGFVQFVGSVNRANKTQTTPLTRNAENLKKQADAAYLNRDWQSALQLYSQLEKASQTEDAYLNLLSCALNSQQWDDATLMLRDRIDAQQRLNNWQAVADAYRQLFVLNEYQENKQAAQNARVNYQRLVREYGLEYDVAAAWESLALLLYDGGSYSVAIDFYTNAAAVFGQQGDVVEQINAHKHISAIYTQKLGDIDAALNAYDAALQVAVDAQEKKSQAEILIEKSRSCIHFSLFLLANEFAEKAKVLANDLNDASLMNQCDVLLAHIYYALGDVNAAVTVLDSVATDTLSSTTIEALLCRSRILAEQDKGKDAVRLANRATDIADRLRDVDYQEKSCLYLASLHWYQQNLKEALAAANRALLLNNGNANSAHLTAAAILIDMHENDRATQHLEMIESSLQKYADEPARARFYYLSSRVTDGVQAQHWANEAVALSDSLALSELAWRAEWRRALLAVSENNGEAAENFYQSGLSKLNRSCPTTRFDSYFNGYSTSDTQFFNEMVNFNIKHGQINRSLNIAEMCNQRLLAQQHFWERQAFYQNEAKFVKRDSLRQERAFAQASLLLKKNIDDPTADILRQKIDTLQTQLVQNRYFDSTEQNFSDSLDVQHLASTLPKDVLVLRMFYDENHVHSWVISRDSVYYIQAPFDVDTLKQNINELYISLNTRESTDAPAAALYANLIAPVAYHLASKNTLVVLPFGEIANVPFALLARAGTLPLGLEKQIIYATRLPRSFSKVNRSIKDIGAVITAANGTSATGLSENVAKSLSRYFSNVTVYNKDNFIDATALPSMNHNDAVYLGLKLKINSRFPFDAKVMPPFASRQNSLVFQHWLSQLSTSLLVLQSRESTALTPSGQSLGFYDGLLNSSTKMIIAPQWTPDELAGAVLIKRFFFYLSEGRAPGEALRLAQKTVYDHIDAHPSAWAVYRLFGDF